MRAIIFLLSIATIALTQLPASAQRRPPASWYQCSIVTEMYAYGQWGTSMVHGVAPTVEAAKAIAISRCLAQRGRVCVIESCGHPCQSDCGG